MTTRRGNDGPARGGLPALAIAAFAIVCCAGLPLLVALAGSIALGAVFGTAAAMLALVALIAVVARWARRRQGGGRIPAEIPTRKGTSHV